MHRLVAVGVRLDLGATVADLGHDLETGGTTARVALDRTLMPASPVDLLATVITGWLGGLAVDRGVYLGFATGTEKGLG